MNFYKRYMADYGKKTARLTLAQHGAYTLLLDEVYASELPLPADVTELFRICRAMGKAEQDAVKFVAEKFFPMGEDGVRCNKRVAQELVEAKQEADSVRAFWRQISPADRAAMQARRRAAELNAAPPWLTTQDLEDIACIYRQARQLSAETGQPHEVDHIVPLLGTNVRGLHVAWNLRAIPANLNRSKGRSHG